MGTGIPQATAKAPAHNPLLNEHAVPSLLVVRSGRMNIARDRGKRGTQVTLVLRTSRLDTAERSPASVHAKLADEGTDVKLVAAILRKDRKATAEFVARYADPIYAYVCSRLTPRMDLVDDLVQEVFLAAWKYLTEYRGASSLQTWLLGIARHKVENYYRARLREPEPLEETDGQPPHALLEPEYDDHLDRERSREKTHRILASLPESYRLALLWRYWEKRSAREMAAQTGKTEKAIERLLARARSLFRQRWQNV